MAGIRSRHPSVARSGFTLIELMIVVVIVGLLLGVAVPRVGASIARDRVDRATFMVQGVLDEATQIARRRGVPVTVTVVDQALRINLRSSGAAIKTKRFGSTSDMVANIAINPTTGITIFPNGRANAAVTITVSGSGNTNTVTRSATGIVRRQ